MKSATRAWAVVVVFAMVSWAWSAEPVAVGSDDLLFLAHFNHTLTPEKGNSEGMINRAELTAGFKGYPFLDSVPGPEALNVHRGRRYLVFPVAGNFDVRQGTLQFMVQPQWGSDGYGHCVLFKLVFAGGKREGLSTSTENSFVIQKLPRRNELAFSHAGDGITRAIPYSTQAWHQIAVTWDQAAGQRTFYINGEKVGEGKYLPMTETAVEFILGAPLTWNAQAFLDEVRILRRVLSEDEIRQDCQALLAGREFPLPGQAAVSVPKLTPKTVVATAAGFAASLHDAGFTVAKSSQEAIIDGALDEAPWQTASPITGLVTRRGETCEASTAYRLFYTDQALYISAEMQENDMANLVAMYDQRDQAIYNDDCMEFLLDIDGESERFYHFAVNALGSLFDARTGDSNWNGNGIEAKGVRHDLGWRVEMRIPFAAFGLTAPLPGEYWGARFGRQRRAGKREVSSAPQVADGGYNQRAYLGLLRFSSGAELADWRLHCPRSEFQLGCNQLSLELANRTATDRNLFLQAIQFDTNNHRLAEQDGEVTVPAGGAVTHDFSIDVLDDTCERIVLLLTDDQGAILATEILRRGFIFVDPGLRVQAELLRQLQHGLGSRSTLRHPVYQGAAQAIQQLDQVLQGFQAELEQARQARRVVPAERYAETAAWVKGFQDFQDNYRYLAWEVNPWDYGSPDELPPMDYDFDRLKLSFHQGGNEREAVTFVLSGLLCGARLDLRVVPIAHDVRNRPFISGDNFEVFTEPYMDHNGVTITAPLVQAPGNIVTLTPGSAQRVWVIFNSRGVPPGDYETRIDLKPSYQYGIPNRSLPVELNIWKFTLPETHEWPLDCFFWTGQFIPLDETALLRLMHDYHINWTMTESINYTRGFINDRRKRPPPPEGRLYNPELTRTANQEFFEEAKRLKMKFIFAWGTGPDLAWHQIMDERLEKMGFTRDDYIFKGGIRDEFKKSDIPANQAFRDAILAANPGWKFQAVYLSTPPPSGATLEDLEAARLTDFYKNWTIISGRLADPQRGPETIAYFRERGCDIWPYRCNRNMQTLPVLEYYRFFPWFAYLNDLDGVAFWTAYSSKGDDGFDHRDGYDDGIAWRGIKKTPIPTKRLQAVREGLEDVAYMHLLKQALEQARGRLGQDELAKYEKLLKETPAQLMQDNSQAAVNTWRRQTGEAIDALQP